MNRSIDTESILLRTLRKRDQVVFSIRNQMRDNTIVKSEEWLMGSINFLLYQYGENQMQQMVDSLSPRGITRVGLSEFVRLYPLSVVASHYSVNSSQPGGLNHNVRMVNLFVFNDMATKVTKVFSDVRVRMPSPEAYTMGNFICTVARDVFNITIPSTIPHTHVLGDLCQSDGPHTEIEVINLAMQQLAMMRWSSSLNSASISRAVLAEEVMTPYDCFELAYRWNRFVANTFNRLHPLPTRHLMQYEREFAVIFEQVEPPLETSMLSPITYVARYAAYPVSPRVELIPDVPIIAAITAPSASSSASASAPPVKAPVKRICLTYSERRKNKQAAAALRVLGSASASSAEPTIRIMPRSVAIVALQSSKDETLGKLSVIQRAIVVETASALSAEAKKED